jgi:D-glycero-beta-D-manno-heptose 1-phosphate adenylyltransferase
MWKKNLKKEPIDYQKRILRTPEQLESVRQEAEKVGKTVVSTNGCFDLLHRGHVHILKTAGELGDLLIVGLNTDKSVRDNKGPQRPLVPEEERAEILLAFENVDYVYLYDEPSCVRFVQLARPHVHVNDASYTEHCVESETVKAGGGRLHLVEKMDAPSTTEIISKIVSLR